MTQMAFKLLRIFFEKSHQKPYSKKQKYLIQYSVARRGGAIAPPHWSVDQNALKIYQVFALPRQSFL